jgi:hypothetical protein
MSISSRLPSTKFATCQSKQDAHDRAHRHLPASPCVVHTSTPAQNAIRTHTEGHGCHQQSCMWRFTLQLHNDAGEVVP